MANITIPDIDIDGGIELDSGSLFSKTGLKQLVPQGKDFVDSFNKPLGTTPLKSVSFDAQFTTPRIALDDSKGFEVTAGVKPALNIFRVGDSPLLGGDDFTPAIKISQDQAWLGLQIGGSVGLTAKGRAPNGVGVKIEASASSVFTVYKLFDAGVSVGDAIRATLSEFRAPANAAEIRAQKPGTVLTSELSGSVTVKGSWIVPGSVNTLALADTPLPVEIDLQAGTSVTLTGLITITGEFVFRSWKRNDSELVIGVYKKKGTTLGVGFTATAGVEADVGDTDLIGKIFGLLSPSANTSMLGADPTGIRQALKDSVDMSLTMSLNATCSASFTDESAFIYTVDLSRNIADTDEALNAAISGDWSRLGPLPNAVENRNAISHMIAAKHKMVVNILGVYNFASVDQFISKCTVVHCPEDGSATITDVETAKRIAVGSSPHRAEPEQLRKALGEAAISTAAYSFAKAGNSGALTSSQTLVIYNGSADARKLTRELAPAVVLGMVDAQEVQSAVGSSPHRHVLLQFEQRIEDSVARLMFLNPATGQPWKDSELVAIGIGQLRALLDPNDPEDNRRLEFLARWPETQPAAPFAVDWLDIRWWAGAVANASEKYVAAKTAFEKLAAGEDPAKNADFMRARKDLAHALLSMSKNEHSAFTPGWPLAVMNRIARGMATTTLNASWDGKTQLQLPARSAAV